MSDISEYSTTQQKVIKEIITNDNGFHSSYMIADMPFYGMLTELENGQTSVRSNVTCPLSTGSVDYELQLFYSSERSCWFYVMSNSDDEIRGIVRYNTVVNAKGELAFVILNDNEDTEDISPSLPYSNVLILRK